MVPAQNCNGQISLATRQGDVLTARQKVASRRSTDVHGGPHMARSVKRGT
jgi:hypothetical protein